MSFSQTQHIDLSVSKMDYSCTCRYHTLIDALPDYITVNVGDLECLRSNLHIHVVTVVSGKKEFNILFKLHSIDSVDLVQVHGKDNSQ